MDNLEKLIQMATIEHMYSMLQKMKTETSTNFKECNFSDEKYSTQNNALIGSLLNEIKNLKTEMNDHTEKMRRNNGEIWQLTQSLSFWRERTEKLENELNQIKSNTNNNSKFLCQQIRGQQKLTSYPGFSNGSPNEKADEAHIKLKIEEKLSNDESCDADKESNHSDEEDEEEDEYEEEEEELSDEEDVNPAMITCSTITLDVKPVVEESHQDETVVEEVHQHETVVVASEEEEEEEEESEEEVGTDDEKEDLVNVEVHPPVQDQEEEEGDDELSVGEELGEHVEPVTNRPIESKEEEEEAEEEEVEEEAEEEVEEEEAEEEEEVFEIEIDDVTYFATGEENGILYEMTSDGDIGKKVGIIKDGEPIFN
jgi:hypothetical protein